MRCASCSLLLKFGTRRRDGETYIGDLRSQAALTYSNHAAFRSSPFPGLAVVARRIVGEQPARVTAASHRGPTHRAVSTTGRPQEPCPHHRLRTERARRARARHRPARRAGRDRGTVADGAGPGVERRSLGPALGTVGLSNRRRGRTRPRGSAAAATHAGETLDAVLAPLDPYRCRVHRSAV